MGSSVVTLVIVHEADGDGGRVVVEVDGQRRGGFAVFVAPPHHVRVVGYGPPLSAEERSYMEDEGVHAVGALAALLHGQVASGTP
jgi:monoamine oxidase